MRDMGKSGDRPVKIVIAGGGTAGWMTAAALSSLIDRSAIRITLVESEEIGTVGVGEATLPHLRYFNERIGVDEADFIRATNATIKLGIEFRDWGRLGDAYIHPFGDYGQPIAGVEFHHYWRRMRALGDDSRICDYSLPIRIAELMRFARPSPDARSLMSTFSYAYHVDASLYARFLRGHSEARGVTRIEGKIAAAPLREDGAIRELTMQDGQIIEGDFFIDCTGFRALLIGGALGAEYEDWSAYLPCDRAIAAPCANDGPPAPYTRATASRAGWRWRIPLQHRAGNGYVYSSDYISDDDALAELLAGLAAPPQAEPRTLRFKAGKRPRQWMRNCIAVGLSSGFLEPLESTSIYLIQAAATAIAELFPTQGEAAADIDEFNRVMNLEYDRVRDFLVLHYHATERDDTPFWRRMRTMEIPDTLADRMALFRRGGYVVRYKDGLFLQPSWIAVYLGQRIVPQGYDRRADQLPEETLRIGMRRLREDISAAAGALPTHQAFLDRLKEPA